MSFGGCQADGLMHVFTLGADAAYRDWKLPGRIYGVPSSVELFTIPNSIAVTVD